MENLIEYIKAKNLKKKKPKQKGIMFFYYK